MQTSGTRTDKTANLEVGTRTPNLFNQTCGEGHAGREHLQTRFEKVSETTKVIGTTVGID